jgi:integrase
MRLYSRPNSPFLWADLGVIGGQRHRVSTGETGKRAAAQSADRIRESIEQQLAPRPRDWTISQCLGTWWDDHATTTRSANWIWSNIENLNRCLAVATPVSGLTNAMLLDFRATRRGEGVQGPTINRDLAYLGAALRHCHDMHGVPVPDVNWKRLKYPENEWRKRHLSTEEYAALHAAADEDLQLLLLAAVTTGLRRGNLFALEWHQLDLTARTVTIPTSKGRESKVKRLAAPLAAALTDKRQRLARDTDAVPSGKVFELTNWRRRWARATKAANLVDFHFHDLRHTFATWARRGGVSITGLREALDHSDVKMTMRYDNVTPDEIATTFDRAASLLPTTSGTQTGTPKTKTKGK